MTAATTPQSVVLQSCRKNNNSTMSMFSGIGNQISGFVSSKIPGAAPAGGEPAAEAVDPNDPNAAVGENGEVPQEGGAMGFAKGLLGKAMAVKDGAMAKAGEMGAGNIGVSVITV